MLKMTKIMTKAKPRAKYYCVALINLLLTRILYYIYIYSIWQTLLFKSTYNYNITSFFSI